MSKHHDDWDEPELVRVPIAWSASPDQGWITVADGVQVRIWNRDYLQVRRRPAAKATTPAPTS